MNDDGEDLTPLPDANGCFWAAILLALAWLLILGIGLWIFLNPGEVLQ